MSRASRIQFVSKSEESGGSKKGKDFESETRADRGKESVEKEKVCNFLNNHSLSLLNFLQKSESLLFMIFLKSKSRVWIPI